MIHTVMQPYIPSHIKCVGFGVRLKGYVNPKNYDPNGHVVGTHIDTMKSSFG